MRGGSRRSSPAVLVTAVVLVAVAVGGCTGGGESVLGEPEESTSQEPTSDQPTDTDEPTDEPTETTEPSEPTGEPPSASGALLLSPVRRQLPAPNGPACRSQPAQDLWCTVDGSTRYLLAPDPVRVGVVEAQASADDVGGWVVTVRLDEAGGRTFARLSTRLARTSTQLAVVVGDTVVTAPTIQEPITGGVLQVSGDFTRQQATALARRLS